MRVDRAARAAAAVLSCLIVGCAGKPPEEVEAERARANAEWNAQTADAERARQAEENRLVREELAAHERREQVDEQRENESREAAQAAEGDRLLKLVAAGFPDPAATNVTNARWNDARTAMCGRISARAADGRWSEPVAFVASGDEAVTDAAAASAHARFLAAAQAVGCNP